MVQAMKVQILDYSINGVAAPLFKRYLPRGAEVVEHFISTSESFEAVPSQDGVTHVIHSGSALSINQDTPFTQQAIDYIKQLSHQGTAQMGICYGHQLICRALLGLQAVRPSPNGFEAGWCDVQFLDDSNPVLELSGTEVIWQHHFDEVIELPPGSELIATSSHSQVQAYINRELSLFGMQFHPEFDVQSGNDYFLKDRELIGQHGLDVNQLIQRGPSKNHGAIFFDYFLNQV